jgi:FMN phosphatase YigB (HAD superfamily)
MNEVAVFDLDGTLIDLQIDPNDFERHRSFWASYLTARGIPTTLKPLLPELKRISQTSLGSSLKADILSTFDDIELACHYRSLGRIETVLSAVKSRFRKLVLVSHNSSALWSRLTQENAWTRLVDTVITRDQMDFFKPDPRVCESVFTGLAPNLEYGECWVIGNSNVDRELGVNLRQEYSNLIVRTVRVDPSCNVDVRGLSQLDADINSVNGLLGLLQAACD